MTTRITADNIAAGAVTSDRIAANAVTLDKIAVGTFGPRITGIVLPGSAVAVMPNGSENFTINGSNFQPGVQVYIGTTPAAAVTYISSTQLVVLVPVMSPGTYPLYVTNTDGGTAIRLLAVTISTAPVWATDSVLPTQFTTLNLQLSAVSDSSVIYTLASGSSLPAGLSLSTAGVLSGTISNITISTTYNFTVVATDLESQTNSRAFSVSVTVGDLSFPAVTLLLQTGASLSRSTTVTDVATPLGIFTASGSPTFGSTSPYQPDGYWSNQFNGSTDWITAPANAAYQMGAGAFTIECWVNTSSRVPGGTTGKYIIGTYRYPPENTDKGWGIVCNRPSGAALTFFMYVPGTGMSLIYNAASILIPNIWNHIAVCRNETSVCSMYLNGTRVATSSSFTVNDSTTGLAFNVGSEVGTATTHYDGYVSNARVVKGTAVYDPTLTTLTVPTAPLTAIANTSILTCQSNRFKDNSTNNLTITANGTPLVSAETPFQIDGYWSNQFNGSTDWLIFPTSTSALALGNSDFTAEAWVYRTSGATSAFVFIGQSDMNTTFGSSYGFYVNGAASSDVYSGGTGYGITSPNPTLNAWAHVAWVRTGGTFSSYLNGARVGTRSDLGSSSVNIGTTAYPPAIGASTYPASVFTGYISNFRLIKGSGGYNATSATITVPTSPLTATANTSLLTCQSNSFKDNSSNNFTITRNGAPAIKSVVQPFISSITSNGAALFNGSSSYLSATPITAVGTGAFTMEAWVYLNATTFCGIMGSLASGSVDGSTERGVTLGISSTGISARIGRSSTGQFDDISGSATIVTGTWYHVALVRVSTSTNQTFLYLNGVQVGVGTSTQSPNKTQFVVGRRYPSESVQYLSGYISNPRIVNGIAVYTGAFTPPSNFLTTTGGTYPSTTNVNTSIAATDTALLANFNDSTYSGASTLNTVTRNGNPSTGWVSPYQTDGYWGNSFNGTTDYLTVASNSGLAFGTNNFTIEFWVYLNTASGTQIFYSSQPAGSYAVAPDIYLYNSKLYVQVSSTNPINGTGPTTLVANRWYHIALVRNTGTTTLYLNGVLEAAFSDSNTYVISANRPVIGVYGNNTTVYFLNGYISNLRVVNGTAIVPSAGGPTSPLTPVANTSLLTCQSNRFLDTNTQLTPKVITPSGTPQVTPYYYPSGFTAPAASPGAAYFNGSTDYLSIADSLAFTLSNVNWTIECWIYCPNNAINRSIAGHCNSTTTVASSTFILYLNDVNRLYIEVYSGSTTYSASTSANVPYNQWSHIVATRDGSTVRLYINGVQYGTVSVTGVTLNDSASNFSVARIGEYPNWTFLGYISNFRLVNGTCVYPNGTTFTPPTAPVTAITNTTVLLNLGDSNYTSAINAVQNNTFIDTGPYAFPITRNSTPTQGSRTPYWPAGQWSNYFNGSSYIRSPGFNFSTSDFTIELFLNTAFLGAGPQFLGGYDSTGNNYTITMQAAGLITYYLSSDGSNWNIAAGVSLGTAVANRWHHIVIARTGTTIRGYFDGVGGTAITTSAAIFNNATNFWLGAAGSAGGNLTGYLSNVRILNGSSAYNANQPTITVPGAPFATGTTNQVLLTCYSNRFIDANTATTAKAITVTGGAQVQAVQPFSPTVAYTPALYGGSGYFTGSGYLTAPDNAVFSFGTGDFTVEAWIYLTTTGTYQGIFANGPNAAGSFTIETTDSNRLIVGIQGGGFFTGTTPVIANTWYHVAASRSGGTIRSFLNGQQEATGTLSYNQTANKCVVGLDWASSTYYMSNGYISDLRVVKGTAIYTANFTPPTAPLTAIANTSLLLNFTNAAIYDAAAQNNAITVGDAQASSTPTAKWPLTSVKFDGTGDWLLMPNSQLFNLTGNFTIEFWINLSSTSGEQAVFHNHNSNNNGILIRANGALPGQMGILSGNGSGWNFVLDSTSAVSIGVWTYVAFTRSGNLWTIYINGVSSGTVTNSATPTFSTTDQIQIGRFTSGTPNALNGYLQDFRITNGVARTVTTVPTAAFLTR
jgi:hypothetical protein